MIKSKVTDPKVVTKRDFHQKRDHSEESSTSSMSLETPSFLTATVYTQRENFGLLNSLEVKRIQGREIEWDAKVGTSEENSVRNRYFNVYPYDSSRVKLPVLNSRYSDYINASYVEVGEDKYIATQGPLKSTTHQFWAMAFNEATIEDEIVIVMVTPLVEGGVTKCFQYWPSLHELISFTQLLRNDGIDLPSLEVTHIKEEYNTEGDYLLTELELKSGDVIKKVHHFYYYKWADAKVPPSISPLLQLSQDIREIDVIPIIHCSAGVGRTGTFIAIDHLFHNYSKVLKGLKPSDDYVSEDDPILRTVSLLRKNRMMMVQTVYQYNFLYESAKALFERGCDH